MKPRTSAAPIPERSAAFTLIETLVALTVLALLGVTVYTTLTASLRAERMAALERTATLIGEDLICWRHVHAPLDSPDAPPPLPEGWQAQRLERPMRDAGATGIVWAVWEVYPDERPSYVLSWAFIDPAP